MTSWLKCSRKVCPTDRVVGDSAKNSIERHRHDGKGGAIAIDDTTHSIRATEPKVRASHTSPTTNKLPRKFHKKFLLDISIEDLTELEAAVELIDAYYLEQLGDVPRFSNRSGEYRGFTDLGSVMCSVFSKALEIIGDEAQWTDRWPSRPARGPGRACAGACCAVSSRETPLRRRSPPVRHR